MCEMISPIVRTSRDTLSLCEMALYRNEEAGLFVVQPLRNHFQHHEPAQITLDLKLGIYGAGIFLAGLSHLTIYSYDMFLINGFYVPGPI